MGFGAKQTVYALQNVNFNLYAGETLALVGESGCGKSTLARCVLQLLKPSEGEVRFMGQELTRLKGQPLRAMRQHVQMIFQNPHSSLNPRMSVRDILAEPFLIHHLAKGVELTKAIETLLNQVGLPRDAVNRYPHEFSGGQKQRIGIARALALKPKLIIADEPLSALDVSIQAQILNLLSDLKEELGLTYLLIAHNLDVVQAVSDRVLVMYLGKVVEEGPVEAVFHKPAHPYTQALLAAVPIANPQLAQARRASRVLLSGEPPSPLTLHSTCAFTQRCPHQGEVCLNTPLDSAPPWVSSTEGQHQALCLKAHEWA
jgi:peptide/nickel transport system ATP-binding protein